jgi:hypothetical protein
MIETGIFYSRHDAEEAVSLLHELGYRDDEISVIMSDRTRAKEFAESTGSKVGEGTATGGIVIGVTPRDSRVHTETGEVEDTIPPRRVVR